MSSTSEGLEWEDSPGRGWVEQFVQVLPEGVLIVDQTGTYITCNAAAADILGVSLLGQTESHEIAALVGDVRYPDGSSCPADEQPLRRSLLRGETVRGEQILLRRRDGHEIVLVVTSAPLRDENGAVVGAGALLHDVSGIRALAHEKDAFLRTVSHDLKNRLNAATGWVQVLQRRLGRLQEPEQAHFAPGLAALDANLQRLGSMVDELVDLTRLQLGRPLPLRRTAVDLVALAHEIAAEQQQQTDRHVIRVETAEPTVVGEWDRARIERVLANLVTNAIQYSPAGGDVVVSVAVERALAQSWAVVRVRDQGLGVPAGDLPRLFQQFYRGRNVADRIEGTGLGLAGARQIVEQHGGSIAAESAEGAGSTFVVRLPLSAVPPATA